MRKLYAYLPVLCGILFICPLSEGGLVGKEIVISSSDQDDYCEHECDEDCRANGCCRVCPYYDDEDIAESWYDDDTWPGKREDSWFEHLER